MPPMSTAAEIECAIQTLPSDEYAKLLVWLDERRAAQVDADWEAAILSGKFDRLAERAARDIEAGETVPLEEFLRRPR